MPQNAQNLQQLEADIALVQIELRQIRQMIGSLIRTEERTMHMLSQQPRQPSQQQQMQSMPNQNQSPFKNNQNWQGTTAFNMPVPPQLLNEERRSMEQYGEMRNTADRMFQQVQNFVQAQSGNRDNLNTYSAQQMNPPHNDPTQRQF
ncbi:hypothetical protein CIG75_16240 [Tumebacillus algifaecis]|uniref:Uncharacterized protein n=1 Tax=Tumebacillus algifaecis TaxID=1214604 RepID=A0A223D491_9BACL|nr:hypothetical protein [Tumebacillus algifaecis]ASS76345.1 hypothetical protein CIG75_16240 [Tumebacillus algifaecis]